MQRSLDIIKEKPLSGDVVEVPNVSFSFAGWFSGDFSSQKEKYLNDNFGFRNFFVRLRNQFYFSVFRKVFAKDVVCGKEGYLYEIKYLKTHAGIDYLGEEKISSMYEKLKFIQDTLNKRGIKLVVLIAPGKATFYPEFIPVPYNTNSNKTNYLKGIEEAKKYSVNFYDFNQLFIDNKYKSKYPLYPKTGTHWSTYGMYFAFDKLTDYLEELLGKKMVRYDYSNVVLTDSLRHPDGDIANGINLIYDLPHFKMAYPEIKWNDTSNTYRPKVLTVSDSYWMGIYFLDLPKKVFSDHEFWYYNRELYNYDPSGKTRSTLDYDLKESVEKYNVIFIMATEASLKQIGWGFIDDVYNMYKNGHSAYEEYKKDRKIRSEIQLQKEIILGDEEWYANVRIQAKELNISIDSCLELNAEYKCKLNLQNEKKDEIRSVSEIKNDILNNKEWYQNIVKQAKERNISIDSNITINAIYFYNLNHSKEDEEKVKLISKIKSEICNNKEWYQNIVKQAKDRNISIDSNISLNAEYFYKMNYERK